MTVNLNDASIIDKIHELIRSSGASADNFEGDLITQMIQTSLRLLQDKHDAGQLKLITRALKEMRYAYNIFNKYIGLQRVSIFGSARTPENHSDYIAAKKFSMQMAEHDWMCMTGAADGIMKAGLEGTKATSRFGLSIRLPFETSSNTFIEGDPKLMIFRYFFTRKLMFVSHSHAVAVFPGGFGTMDELFEVLTLIQTGKASIMPVVLMEGDGGDYWQHWRHYLHKHLLGKGWISADDEYLYYIAPSIASGVQHIQQFYKRYHSSRYVKDQFIIRLKSPLDERQVALLNQLFSHLLEKGEIEQVQALPEEDDVLELPRLALYNKRREVGLLRCLIDQVNEF